MTSTIKVDNIQNQCGANIINESSNTITIGASGDTVSLASGASQSGFGRTGSVDWQTTKKTANFTATSGEGYFCDTSSGAFTLTLPASPSAGDIVGIRDYASTFATNNLTIGRNSSNLNGTAADFPISTNNKSLTLVYVDSTKGWIPIEEGTGFIGEAFITASGGTETTCGDFKIHTFTGPGTFTVSSLASTGSDNVVDYLVVAGGGGGARDNAGGAGAGGLRFFATCLPSPSPASPRNAPAGLTVTAQSYPITVGSGGASGNSQSPNANPGLRGSDSSFITITSTGGGGSAGDGQPSSPNQPGGSGGGRGQASGGVGSGNTPPVSPSQGSDGGGDGGNPGGGGGGGGFLNTGSNRSGDSGGAGGDGGGFPTTHFGSSNGVPCGSFRYFAGGGGGGNGQPGGGSAGAGGKGGGGAGSASSPGSPQTATAGTANSGGGSGGGGQAGCGNNGGSGIVIIRYKYQ